MSTIGTSTNDRKRHLKTLQEKSFEIAAGDVVGGLIYVMDKPLGIEEGMIGMSIDSPGYRGYLNILVSDLDDKRKKQSSHQNKALQAKYNLLIKDPDFNFASLDEATKNVIIDLFLHHPNIARYLASLEDDEKQRVQAIQQKYLNIDPNEPMHKIMPVPFMENVRKFFSLRMHEITTKRYANEGMGGLLFGEYKQHCGVVDGDHFSAQIKKLMHANQDTAINDVYMVKQDGKLGPFHGTGPGFSKILKTSTGKKLQANFTFPRILSIVLPVYSLVQLGVRRLGYLIKNDPISVNSEAIAETMATKLAANRGCEAQQIETLKGTYEDGSPKVTTLVTWTPGCKDFSSSEKVMGNKSSQDGLLVAQTANGETIKRDKEGNLYYRQKVMHKDKLIGYDYYKNGKKVDTVDAKNAAKAYENAFAIAEDRIDGLGESLATLIAQGDRDAIGKKGQNKAFLPTENGRFKFYGIDFGKAYRSKNPILASLKDDFSFKSPTAAVGDVYFSNYSILYDNPLRDKMKGIYLLAALRGKLTDPQKEQIAKEFEEKDPKDPHFAQKLRNMPKPGESPEEIIDIEIKKYQDEKDKNPEKAAEFNLYIKKLEDIKRIAKQNDDAMLDVFAKRYQLLPSQIDALERMEKLTAKKATATKKDKKLTILRKHIFVESNNRIPWQFENGRLSAKLDAKDVKAVQEKFNKMLDILREQKNALDNAHPQEAQKLDALIQQLENISFKAGTNQLPLMNPEQLRIFSHYVSEDKIAKVHDLKEYMNEEQRKAFSAMRDVLDDPSLPYQQVQTHAPTVAPVLAQTQQAPNIDPVSPLFEVNHAPVSPVLQTQPQTAPVLQTQPQSAPVQQTKPQTAPVLQQPQSAPVPGVKRKQDQPPDDAQQQQRRPRSVTIRQPDKVPPIPALEAVAEQNFQSLKELDDYTQTDKEAIYKLHHINDIQKMKTGNFQQYDTRVIFFERPKNSGNHGTMFAQASSIGLTYSTPITDDLEKFRLVAEETCRLAVYSSKSNKPMYMSPSLSDEKKAIMQQAFTEAVRQAIEQGIVNPESKPELLTKERTRVTVGQGPLGG